MDQGALAMSKPIRPAIDHHDANVPVRRHNRNSFSQPISVRHLCRGGVRTTRGIRLDLGQGGVGAIVQGGVLVGDTVAIDLRLRRPLYRSQNPRIPARSLTDSLLRFVSNHSSCSSRPRARQTPSSGRQRVANEGFNDLATWLILISIPKPKL